MAFIGVTRMGGALKSNQASIMHMVIFASTSGYSALSLADQAHGGIKEQSRSVAERQPLLLFTFQSGKPHRFPEWQEMS
ncbi:hypothetical protein BOO91_05605 [Vibrio navarrensis]|nr:hypothetical protein [Vibrio navarrensis]MBE3655939.1 hypothetical protein [Vibrio navarrensis]MBE3660415.1 hypothetical protein [Vibrio navarrensis]MBE4602678.1 hypothetical protein [Vibrio navarrensis]